MQKDIEKTRKMSENEQIKETPFSHDVEMVVCRTTVK